MRRAAAAATAACTVAAAVFAAGRPDHLGPVMIPNPSAAMAPALPAGSPVLVDRDAYRPGRGPAPGDVVAVGRPTPAIRAACGTPGYPLPVVVLRVAGVAGQRVAVRGGLRYLDGRRAPVPGERRDTARYDRDFGVVPAGSVLLLGDNRPGACDARLWAQAGAPFLPEDALLGRVLRPSPVSPP